MSTSISPAVLPAPRPRRPVGVVIAAVVLALMACFVVLFGLVALASVLLLHSERMTTQMQQFPALKAIQIVNGIVILLVGGLCAWTAVDLFRVKRWARISVLILGGIVAFFSLVDGAMFGVLAYHPITLSPQAARVPPEVMRVTFLVLAGLSFLFMLVGVWWLVYFNLKHVRTVFAARGGVVPAVVGEEWMEAPPTAAATAESGTMGVLVSCLAILYLLGAAGAVMGTLLHLPLLLFSHIFIGNAASMIMLFLAAVCIWMGIGLLRRIKAAWAVALVFNAFGILSELWLLLPSSHMPELMQELLARMAGHGFPVEPNPMLGPMIMIGALGGIIVMLAVMWLLWRAKPLFEAK